MQVSESVKKTELKKPKFDFYGNPIVKPKTEEQKLKEVKGMQEAVTGLADFKMASQDECVKLLREE